MTAKQDRAKDKKDQQDGKLAAIFVLAPLVAGLILVLAGAYVCVFTADRVVGAVLILAGFSTMGATIYVSKD